MIDCISMYQPWAQWVALGWKPIETRRHNKLACLARRGRRIVIHAADKWDSEWWIKSREFITSDRRQITMAEKDRWPRGALICTVFPTELSRLSSVMSNLALCDCSGNDLYGLILKDAQRFDPIKWSGHQGIMKVPEEVIEKAVKG